MKIGKRSESKIKATRPDKQSGKTLLLIAILGVTAAMIVWVYSMGKKAEQTISVAMLSDAVYKNELVTEGSFKEYQMLVGEFEKYAVNYENGYTERRIILWDEVPNLVSQGAFAAYPLQSNTIAMFDNFLASRVNNSDTIMYSFPGKEIIPLTMGDAELSSFKTFLQPGDRINVTAIYSTTEKSYVINERGETVEDETEVYREEVVFKDIMLADILNGDGNSVLDIYTAYKDLTVYQQAYLDSDEDWQHSVEPSTLLVALTPEERTRYYQFLARQNVEFHMSLPQRIS